MTWEKAIELAAAILTGSAATVIANFILRYRKQSHEQDRQKRLDALEHEQEEERDALSEYKSLFVELRRQLTNMRKEIDEIRHEHLKCREEAAELRGKIKLLEYRLSRYETSVTPPPPSIQLPSEG